MMDHPLKAAGSLVVATRCIAWSVKCPALAASVGCAQDELENIENVLRSESKLQRVTREEDGTDEEDRVIGAATASTTIRAAADSGSVDSVIHLGEVPALCPNRHGV